MHTMFNKDELALRIRLSEIDPNTAFNVNKFGMNLATAAGDDVHDGSNAYTGWLAAATAIEVLSGEAEDASPAGDGVRTMTIEGLDANKEPQSKSVTMNGVGVVAVAGTWMRVFRAYITSSGDTQTNEGLITIRVASAGATVALITAGYGQTEMALYTIPAGYTGLLFEANAQVKSESAANVTATFHLSTNEDGKGWRVRHVFDVMGGKDEHEWPGGLELQEKTDIRIRASAMSKAAPTSAEFFLICVKN